MDKLSPTERSQLMAKVKSKDTKPELIVRRKLFSLGYRYRLYSKKLPGCPDLVFASRKKVIFIHGCFWHNHSCKYGQKRAHNNAEYWCNKIARNKKRDQENMRALREQGWRIAVIWECQINKGMWLSSALRFLQQP